MTLRSLIDQLHENLLTSFSHVNSEPTIHEVTGRLVSETTKASEWQREATAADVAEIAARVQTVGAAILDREN